MSDLISKSALMKYLRDYKWEFALGSDFSKAIEMVDVQPTAYDVDKVVEQLEDKATEHAINGQQFGADGWTNHEEKEILQQKTYEKAIEIVKGGGVN